MEIIWHGNTCFTFKSKSADVVVNPTAEAGKLKGDLVISNLDSDPAPVEGSTRTFDWPGEYEMKEVPILGLQTPGGTLIYCFEIDGIKICHLGELAENLTSEMVKSVGEVDILIIKAGDGTNLSAKHASELIEEIEPRVVVGMGEGSIEKELKDIGADKIEVLDKFTLKSSSELPEDHRKYIALNKA